jgi:hypothetical protein
MSVAAGTNTKKRAAGDWALDVPVVRQGILHSGGRSIEYTLLQPSPDQWVVMALAPCDLSASPTLIVTEGASEMDAFQQFTQRLGQAGRSSTLNPFVTDWAMRAPER